MDNVHPYFSLKNLGKNILIIDAKYSTSFISKSGTKINAFLYTLMKQPLTCQEQNTLK